jgi:hypothetical protein
VEGIEGFGWEKVGTGAGAEDGVEDDDRPGRIAWLIPYRRIQGGEKSRDSRGDFGRA